MFSGYLARLNESEALFPFEFLGCVLQFACLGVVLWCWFPLFYNLLFRGAIGSNFIRNEPAALLLALCACVCGLSHSMSLCVLLIQVTCPQIPPAQHSLLGWLPMHEPQSLSQPESSTDSSAVTDVLYHAYNPWLWLTEGEILGATMHNCGSKALSSKHYSYRPWQLIVSILRTGWKATSNLFYIIVWGTLSFIY